MVSVVVDVGNYGSIDCCHLLVFERSTSENISN